MKSVKQSKNKRLFQGMGIGYVTCLVTHIIAALVPVYVVFPFTEHLLGHSHGHDHSHSLFNHVLVDLLTLTMIIVPVAALTFAGHRFVGYIRCKCEKPQQERF